MDLERLLQIEELFHAAREGTAGERAALLARADPEVRTEVVALLSQQASEGFLDRPAIQNAVGLLENSMAAGLVPGDRLGAYRIESKLGEGGMAEVFRAVDTRLGRAVAVKVAHEQFSARFEREARAIAAMNHPNICTVYDVGPNYLVMELVEGETLAVRLKNGKLPINVALVYGRQIAAALAEAHAKGIVHRDLKPGNLMIAKSVHGARTARRQTGRCPLGYLFVRLRALRNADRHKSHVPKTAHSIAKAGKNRHPMPGRGPAAPLAIRGGAGT